VAFYENVFIVRQDVSGQQVEELATRFSEVLQGGGGRVERTEFWGLRTMSFRIKKNRKGHYVMLNIDAPAPAIQEMERNMRLNEDVIRYMTLRVDELDEGPSAMMKNRSDRPRGYGDRGDDAKSASSDSEASSKPDSKEDKEGDS